MMSLEKTIKKIEESETHFENPSPNEIDIEFNLDKKSTLVDKIKDIAKYSPFLATQLILAPTIAISTGITAAGFAIGGYFEAKKSKKKYNWQRLKRDLSSGNVFGYLDYALFSSVGYFASKIPYLSGANLLNKLAKLAFFETLLIPPAVAAYNSVEYVRDEMRWKGLRKRLARLKFKSTAKEIYEGAIKGQIWKGAKNIYKVAPPLHFIQLNYLPTTVSQMAWSAFVNNPLFRYVLGKKSKTQNSQTDKNNTVNSLNSPDSKTKENYRFKLNQDYKQIKQPYSSAA